MYFKILNPNKYENTQLKLIVSMADNKSVDEISSIFEKWIREQKLPSNWSPLNLAERERVVKLEQIFNSDKFKASIDTNISSIKAMINEVFNAEPFTFKVKIISKEPLFNFNNSTLPIDNLRINGY